MFTNASTGTPTDTNFDTIINYVSGSDIIDFDIALAQSANTTHVGNVPQAGKAWVVGGVVSFEGTDTTLALCLIAVENAIADLNADGTGGDQAAGDSLVFGFGGVQYIFVSDATAGVGATDVLIKLTGIATGGATDSLTFATNNITGLA